MDCILATVWLIVGRWNIVWPMYAHKNSLSVYPSTQLQIILKMSDLYIDCLLFSFTFILVVHPHDNHGKTLINNHNPGSQAGSLQCATHRD